MSAPRTTHRSGAAAASRALTVAARLARREVIRRPWRSLLVLLLVVVPVTALSALAVGIRTADRTWPEQFASNWGRADAVVHSGHGGVAPTTLDGADPADLLAEVDLPPGTRVVEVRSTWDRLRTTDGRRSFAEVTDLDVGDPLFDNVVSRLVGRPPEEPDEVLLSASLARDLDVGVGDLLELDRPEMVAEVVGTAEWHDQLSRRVMVVDADPAALVGNPGRLEPALVLDLPEPAATDGALLARLQDLGAEVPALPPPWPTSAGPRFAIVWTWVGGAVAFVILGVVIAAAFAVTARRQLRLLGQLQANGAERRTLQAALVLQGTVIGVVGAVVGILVAVAALVAARGVLEGLLDRRLGGLDVRLGDLLPIAVIATVAATVAATVPARAAVRTSVLRALAGRRPVGPYPAGHVARGAIAVAAGLALLAVAAVGAAATDLAGGLGAPMGAGLGTGLFALLAVAGSVAVLLGTCAMAPAVVARLEPLAGRLRGTGRLAARSVARQRARTGPVVAAVAVVAAGAVAGSTAWLSYDGVRYDGGGSVPDDVVLIDATSAVAPVDPEGSWFHEPIPAPPGVVARVLAVVPDGEVIATRVAGDSQGAADDPFATTTFQVVDAAYASTMRLSEPVTAALARRGVVVPGGVLPPNPDEDPVISLPVVDGRGRSITVEAEVVDDPAANRGPLITVAAAERLGLEVVPGRTIVRSPQPLSDDQLEELEDLGMDLSMSSIESDMTPGEAGTFVWLEYDTRAWEPSTGQVTGVLVALATLLSLGVVGLGLALSAAETRDERNVLAAVGAPPRVLRHLAGAKAALLAAIGTVIGVPLGFVPVLAVARAASVGRMPGFEVVFPWAQAGLLVIAVPLVAAATTVAASSLALRLRPVRASSMAFD